jgi:nucleoside-diphosphate-sugar epimerase
MNIFFTGATGVVGRPTLERLVSAGHTVRAIARDDEKASVVQRAGAEPVRVDLFDADAVLAAVAGSDTILHLATNVPPMSRAARKSAWDTHNRLRTEATRNLVAAARAHGVTRIAKESVSFMYPDGGDEWIDESVPFFATDSPLVSGTRRGEEMVERFTGDTGGAGVVLRFGLFYGPGNRGTQDALRLARRRRSTIAGSPDAYMSSIHTDDAATAVVAALEIDSGVYNVVDDEPLTRRAHLDAFGAAFGLPELRPTPRWLIRLLAGADPTRVLTSSQRVSNRRFRDAAGWRPAYSSAREGWAAVAALEGRGSNRPGANRSGSNQPGSRQEEISG